MVRLYLDENVQGSVVEGLRRRGVDLLTVQDDGREGAPDPEVLDRATELGRMLFSQDQDLLAEAARRQRAGEPFAGVVYARQLRVSVGDCIDDLELIATLGELEELWGRVLYLPL
jgi:predicted nuclease of predicted toxin-antitoxin system